MVTPEWLRKFAINYPVVLIAVIWQYIIMSAMLWNMSAVNATALHVLTLVVPLQGIWYIMLLSSTLAIFALASRRLLDTVVFLLPQQALLYLSATASLQAIWLGRFADGVERAHAFILADQTLPILMAIAHTWTLIIIWWRARGKPI